MQKPVVLTTFSRSYYNNNISLDIKDLTPGFYGQFMWPNVVWGTGFPNLQGESPWRRYQGVNCKSLNSYSAFPFLGLPVCFISYQKSEGIQILQKVSRSDKQVSILQ